MNAPRILFAGGGTGGHVYPAIAIADAVRALVPEADVAFAGTRERMEWTAVPKAGYPIHPITVVGFQRRKLWKNIAFPLKLAQGLGQSLALVKAFAPDVAVGTGGFVSGPVLLAASLRGVPTVIQEQNAFAGVTNRLLAKRAAQIHIAFPEAQKDLPMERCTLSGNPTRRALQTAERAEGRRYYDVPDDALLLFMFGGSLGSQALNEAFLRHHAALLADERVYLLWQTGRLYYDRLRAAVAEHPRLRLLQYVDRMDLAYAATDLVVSRAGAITCSELMVTKTPAILVPSPNVAEDHQTNNAQSMVAAEAAVLLPEPDLDVRLVPDALSLLHDDARRAQMADAAGRLARPDAAARIARDVLTLAGWTEEATA